MLIELCMECQRVVGVFGAPAELDEYDLVLDGLSHNPERRRPEIVCTPEFAQLGAPNAVSGL